MVRARSFAAVFKVPRGAAWLSGSRLTVMARTSTQLAPTCPGQSRSRIASKISATTSRFSFAPRLPLPCRRTESAPAFRSRTPKTSVVWTLACSASWIVPPARGEVRVDLVRRVIGVHANKAGVGFGHDGFGVVRQRLSATAARRESGARLSGTRARGVCDWLVAGDFENPFSNAGTAPQLNKHEHRSKNSQRHIDRLGNG